MCVCFISLQMRWRWCCNGSKEVHQLQYMHHTSHGGGRRKGGRMLLCLLFLSVMLINTPRALAAECNKSRVKRNHRPTDCIVADRRRCKIGKQQMNLWLPRCEASTTRWKEHADLRISLFWLTNPSEFPTTAARVAGLKPEVNFPDREGKKSEGSEVQIVIRF